jgi:hypothetical protein
MQETQKILPKTRRKRELMVIGWREWISLPGLGIEHIKVKVDSGARTSALHAFAIQPFKQEDKHFIQFKMHPLQRCTDKVVQCVAEVQDIRWVTDSGGHRERRYVIKTPVTMGMRTWSIEVTLTNRDIMNFRMLLGRTAMRRRVVVNPAASFLLPEAIPIIPHTR